MGSQYESEKVGIILVQEGLNGMHLVQFECTRHWKSPVSSNFEVGWFPFSHYWPSGVIRIGLPVWKWKSWKSLGTKWAQKAANGSVWMSHVLIQFWSWMNPPFHYWPSGVIRIGLPVWKWKSWKYLRTKWAQWAANGPDWMPQAPKPLCLNQFWSWMNSLFQLLALWGNNNWPLSMKVKKMQKFGNKSVLMVCKWSSLNAPGTGNPLFHPILNLGELHFPIIGLLG